MNTLYITGAGVSAESGIPTFRGEDGFWTIGSDNYTPQEMATRRMYQSNPSEFLSWYYHRFAAYRNHGPNDVHFWLADKNLITQNIDGLDGKAGNTDYIAIHGRLDQMTLYHNQENDKEHDKEHNQEHDQETDVKHGNSSNNKSEVQPIATPWDTVDENNIIPSLLQLFNINPETQTPALYQSYKPYVLLFDEYYTELYRISEARQRMLDADRIIFMGTSFSVNITQMALDIAISQNKPIEVVDPNPINIPHLQVKYHKIKASTYIQYH